jgi:hypothetical protein
MVTPLVRRLTKLFILFELDLASFKMRSQIQKAHDNYLSDLNDQERIATLKACIYFQVFILDIQYTVKASNFAYCGTLALFFQRGLLI